MRVLFLTQYFPPEMGAPQARLSELAQGLARHGHHVDILTAMPNYPTGKVFKGYEGKLYILEALQDLTVHRAYIRPDNSRRFIARLISYFSFVFSAMIVGLLKIRRPDVVVVESPPLFLGLTGMALSFIKRSRMIFNVSDLWPETAIRMGVLRNPGLIAFSTWLETMCYRYAWRITGQSPTIVRSIHARCPAKQVQLITNGVDSKRFEAESRDQVFRSRYGLGGDDICIIYAGLLGMAQGIEQIVKAADRCRDIPRIKFLLAGDGPVKAETERDIKTRGLENIRLIGILARDEMPRLLANMDIALITLGVSIPGAVPSKIYEAMGAKLPIVLVADGDPKEMLESCHAGRVCHFGDIESIAASIRELASDPALRGELGRNGRKAVQERFDRRIIIQKFNEILISP